jgi:aryl-alcohol dehydrogenase-like predicted oxidoreductase
MLATAPNVVPIPGASRPETARDSAAAADLRLTDDELARLDASVDG